MRWKFKSLWSEGKYCATKNIKQKNIYSEESEGFLFVMKI